jgi:hypothetical protein
MAPSDVHVRLYVVVSNDALDNNVFAINRFNRASLRMPYKIIQTYLRETGPLISTDNIQFRTESFETTNMFKLPIT